LGTHVANKSQVDVAGDEPDGFKSVLIKNGFQANAVVEGMGEQDGFADIFVEHVAETANDHGVALKELECRRVR
jgi:sirohydrochlorin cobaltochelatase